MEDGAATGFPILQVFLGLVFLPLFFRTVTLLPGVLLVFPLGVVSGLGACQGVFEIYFFEFYPALACSVRPLTLLYSF